MGDHRFASLTKKQRNEYCEKRWRDYDKEKERRCEALGIPVKDKSSSLKLYDEYHGRWGYLRGAYFGGMSDVLQFLFHWVDWNNMPAKGVPFDTDKFERRLTALKVGGKRPGRRPTKLEKSVSDIFGQPKLVEAIDTEGMKVPAWAIKEYEDFLAFGKKLIADGKNPTVYISW